MDAVALIDYAHKTAGVDKTNHAPIPKPSAVKRTATEAAHDLLHLEVDISRWSGLPAQLA